MSAICNHPSEGLSSFISNCFLGFLSMVVVTPKVFRDRTLQNFFLIVLLVAGEFLLYAVSFRIIILLVMLVLSWVSCFQHEPSLF